MTQLELNFCSPEKDLREVLYEALLDDEDWRDNYANRIISTYESFDGVGREKLNDIFICFSGWALDTMIYAYKYNVHPADASEEVLGRKQRGAPLWG